MSAPDPPASTRRPGGSPREVLAARLMCAIAAVAYPGIWLFHQRDVVKPYDPLWIRLVIAGYCLVVLGLSFRSERVRAGLDRLLLGLVYLLTLHFFFLLTWNHFDREYMIGVLLVLIGMNAGSSLGFRGRNDLKLFLATVAAGTVISALLVVNPRIPIPYFLSGMGIAAGVSYVGIDNQLRARDRLLESERRLRAALTGAPIVLWTTDRRGRITWAEGSGLRTLERTEAEALGLSPAALFGEQPDLDRALAAALGGDTTRAEVQASGAIFEAWLAPVRAAEGAISGTVGVATDVTQLHRLGRQLRQSQKLEAVGQLAGGIAHDFNNILTAILGYSQLGLAEAESESQREAFQEIRSSSERAAALVRQLLTFSRRGETEPRAIDLNAAIHQTTSMLRRMIDNEVRLVVALDPDAGEVEIDPTGIEQILMNLVVNASEACPDGGRIVVTSERTALDGAATDGAGGLPPGRYTVLRVTDDGTGMDERVRERAFDPFFTTKEVGRGSGLGLSTVFGIVEDAGGTIHLESVPGRGSTFTIWFPALARDRTGKA